MGRLFIETLSADEKKYRCKCCNVDSALFSDIVSKHFQGRLGPAFLFRNVVNISIGPAENRHLLSGLHTVSDISCSSCQQVLGWRYDKAYAQSEKSKEGLYLLERECMLKDGC